MKKNPFLLLLLISIFAFTFTACSDDDEPQSEYPKTVNIKFEIMTSNNPDAIVSTTINNTTEDEEIDGFPYSRTYAQTEVNKGTYLKLNFDPDVPCVDGANCDFTADLSISVDNAVVKTQMFEMTEGVGVVFIDYTFE